MSVTQRAAKRHRWLPRYSLRSLFIFVALVAVALAWWQRPYEEEQVGGGRRTVHTLRRNLFGPPIMEGAETEFDDKGHKLRETHWSRGMRHGTERIWGTYTGQLINEGQWVQGQKEGTWYSWNADRFYKSRHWFGDDSILGMDSFYKRDIRSEEREYIHDKLIRITRFPISQYHLDRHNPLRTEIEVLDAGQGENESILTRYLSDSEEDVILGIYDVPSWLPKVEQIHFRNGVRDGLAEGWSYNGNPRYVGHWKAGLAEGDWTFASQHLEKKLTLTFRVGRLLTVDGHQLRCFGEVAPEHDGGVDLSGSRGPFAQIVEKDDPSNRQFAQIVEEHDLSKTKSPQHWVAHLRKAHGVNLQIDYRIWSHHPPHRDQNAQWPTTARRPIMGVQGKIESDLRGIPLSAYVLLVADDHDLACAWRFGQLWLTTKESAFLWRDHTGVELLESSTDAGFNEKMNSTIEGQFRKDPLAQIEKLSWDQRPFNHVSIEGNEQLPTTLSFRGTRRDLLGALLDQAGLCFALGEHDELIIRPRRLDDD